MGAKTSLGGYCRCWKSTGLRNRQGSAEKVCLAKVAPSYILCVVSSLCLGQVGARAYIELVRQSLDNVRVDEAREKRQRTRFVARAWLELGYILAGSGLINASSASTFRPGILIVEQVTHASDIRGIATTRYPSIYRSRRDWHDRSWVLAYVHESQAGLICMIPWDTRKQTLLPVSDMRQPCRPTRKMIPVHERLKKSWNSPTWKK